MQLARRVKAEKFFRQLRVKGPDLFRGHGHVPAEHAAPGEIDRGQDQGFVHGEQDVAEALHAPHLAQGLGKGVAETNAHVLDGVVVVHPGVAGAGHGEVEGPVGGKAREHVVEEPDAGLDVVFSRPVQVQGQGVSVSPVLRRCGSLASYTPSSARISSTTLRNAAISSSEPMVTRL